MAIWIGLGRLRMGQRQRSLTKGQLFSEEWPVGVILWHVAIRGLCLFYFREPADLQRCRLIR